MKRGEWDDKNQSHIVLDGLMGRPSFPAGSVATGSI